MSVVTRTRGHPADVRVRHADGLLSRRVLDELLVMAPTGDVVLLSDSAAHVWRMLEIHDRVADLVDHLSRVYGAPTSQVTDDVVGLLQGLVRQGLVVEVSTQAATT